MIISRVSEEDADDDGQSGNEVEQDEDDVDCRR